MCYVAVWMIDYVDEHHGPYWKKWTQHAESVHPDISKIEVIDNCSIYTDCLYGCTHCGYDMGTSPPLLANDPAWYCQCSGNFQYVFLYDPYFQKTYN